MIRTLIALAALTCIAAGPVGDLYQPSYCLDHELRGPAKAYAPQAGDLLFFTDDDSKFWDAGFKMAGTGHPYHSGVVVRMPDGTFATLESGPDDSSLVEVCSIAERLKFHHCNRGRVWVRQRKVPLTEEQSCRLFQFAVSERHKKYALIRMAGQVTLLRSRGPVRTNFMGASHGPKDSYFCSELVLEACVFAGIMDAETTRPRATFPSDFFTDRSPNPYVNKHINLTCTWEIPARWGTDECPPCRAWQGSFWHPNPEAIPVHPYFTSQPCTR